MYSCIYNPAWINILKTATVEPHDNVGYGVHAKECVITETCHFNKDNIWHLHNRCQQIDVLK